MLRDWKFIITFIAGVAGVAVPVWLWRADLNAKSLSLSVASTLSLAPPEKDSPAEVEMSIDGKRLVSPHLTVFELRNDGSKPIASSDFDGPIELRVETPVIFAKARVSSKTPPDLDASLSNDAQRIALQPLLLNANDSLRIAAITSGGAPKFSTKVRIAGVINGGLLDSSIKSKSPTAAHWIVAAFSLAALISAMMVVDGATDGKGVYLRQRAAAFVGLTSGFPAGLGLQYFLSPMGLDGFWYFMLTLLVLCVVCLLVALALNKKPPKTQQ